MIPKKLLILLLLITSYPILSQNTSEKLEISKDALILIKKDLTICDSLAVAYNSQKNTLISLADTNVNLFNQIESINKKSEFWEDQIKKKEDEIIKLQRKKKDRLLWLGAGVLGGVITGVLISN